MVEAKKGLVMKEKLKSVCCSNGWSYAVFWSFDQRNSMLLTVEDVYCEEQMQAVINDMLVQVHVLGEGLVGNVASTKTHQWLFSDVDGGKNSVSSTVNEDIFQENSEIYRQFSCGVKTIAVIFVESQGVLQLGSSQKILESLEFLDQMKKLFKKIEDSGLTSPVNPFSSLNCENYDLNEWFASFCNGNITPMHGGSGNELMEIACSSMNLMQPCPFASDFQQEGTFPSSLDSSHPSDQFHSLASEARVTISGEFSTHSLQMTQQSASSVDNSASKTPCLSTLSNGSSVLTSLHSQRQSEMGFCDSSKLFQTKGNCPVTCSSKKQNFQDDSTLTSFDSSDKFINSLRTTQEIPEKLLSDCSGPLNIMSESGLAGKQSQVKCHEQLKTDDLLTNRSNTYVSDNMFEWFGSSGECGETDVYYKLQSVGVSSVSSGMVGYGSANIPSEKSSNSVQSSITETNACGEQLPTITPAQDDTLEALAFGFLSSQPRNNWENMTEPVVSGGHLASSVGVSQSISDVNISSMVAPRKALFSELGLEELLNGITSSGYASNTSTDDLLSATKRRRLESSPIDGNQVHLSSSCSESNNNTPCNLEKSKSLLSKQEGLLNWIDDRYSINNANAGQAKTKKFEETAKTTRKRARPGESTRPRPKDRQQIQDRLKELKGIIPGGEKCSIDALLDRTIKHMLFLQSVTKYADKLKQANESKDSTMILKDNNASNGGSGGGATWALEVGDQTAVCPIRIEDISSSGLMLIEMLCEDRGFFLELADIIRSFGLNILKGVMEIQEDKILARFIVEAHTHMTRMEIFWSLVELVQQTTNTGIESNNQPSNPMHGKDPLLNNYPQHCFANPIGLAEALQ